MAKSASQWKARALASCCRYPASLPGKRGHLHQCSGFLARQGHVVMQLLIGDQGETVNLFRCHVVQVHLIVDQFPLAGRGGVLRSNGYQDAAGLDRSLQLLALCKGSWCGGHRYVQPRQDGCLQTEAVAGGDAEVALTITLRGIANGDPWRYQGHARSAPGWERVKFTTQRCNSLHRSRYPADGVSFRGGALPSCATTASRSG